MPSCSASKRPPTQRARTERCQCPSAPRDREGTVSLDDSRAGADPVTQRPLTPHDLSGLEALSAAALSPDGRWLAYVHTRPRRTATCHKYDYLWGGDRGDGWIIDARAVPRRT